MKISISKLMGVLAFAMAAGLCGGARAASFDCAKAKTAMEVTICSDAHLSTMDAILATNYQADLAQLSPAGRDALRASERSFLAYVTALCQPGGRPIDENYDSSAECLDQAFKDRASNLKSAVQKVDGHLFLNTTTYRVRPYLPDGQDGDTGESVEMTNTLLQIDNPVSAAEIAWNTQARQAFDKAVVDAMDDPWSGGTDFATADQDIIVTMTVVSASSELICAEIETWTYEKGRPHGFDSAYSVNWLLKPGRPLLASDIFVSGKPWATALAPMAKRYLNFSEEPDEIEISSIKTVDNWQILPEGLAVEFDQSEFGSYSPPTESILPWNEIRPYLRKDLPFDPAKLQKAPDVSSN